MNPEVPVTREDVLLFLNRNPVCHLATVEDGHPRVRSMFMYRADESGLIFHTATNKALAKQVQTGAPVEVCFHNSDVQVRVSGVAEVLDDMELKEEIAFTRPFIQPWIERYGFELLLVFRVRQCRAAVWTVADNFNPTTYQEL